MRKAVSHAVSQYPRCIQRSCFVVVDLMNKAIKQLLLCGFCTQALPKKKKIPSEVGGVAALLCSALTNSNKLSGWLAALFL